MKGDGLLTKKKKIGNYIINPSDLLGQGQYGQVYKAKEQTTGFMAAIKVICKKRLFEEGDEYCKNAVVREIEIMKNLKSPNIIQFLEVHETANNIYIIQELADSGTLKTLMMKHQNGFKEPEALSLIMQMVNGFGELSANGIIHRDIKPTNVLVKKNPQTGQNILKLADFGFSRYSDNMSAMNSIVGTPAYMAPQVLNREIYDKYSYKCDIWSFGVVCYELIVGCLPWMISSNNMEDLFHVLKNTSIKFPADKNISPELKQLIRGCLRFEEKDRLDWTQIFQHKAFQGRQLSGHSVENQQSIEEAFALSRLRMSVHSQNLNIQKILNTMSETFDEESFSVLMKMMDPQINSGEINCVFQAIAKGNKEISKDQLLKHLSKRGIKVTGLKFSHVKRQSSDIDETEKVVQGLKKSIEEKGLDLYELFKEHDKKKNNALNLQDFSAMLQSVNENISKQECLVLFKSFDANSDGQISFKECYTKLCKIAQVAQVQNEELHQSIKKIQKKKQ